MATRNKYRVLILLSVLLGVALWVFDKNREGEGFGSDPIVVDVNQAENAATSGNPDGSIAGAAGEGAVGTEAAPSDNPTGLGTASGGALLGNGERATGADAFAPAAAPEIEAFDAYVTDAGIVLEWISGDESSDQHDTIGYRVYRVASNGTETLVADMTTAASGTGELYNLTESGKDGGHFVIDRVNRDLSVTRLPFSTTARMVAPPEDGLHVIMIQAEAGEAEIDVGSDARNLFILGFQNKPVVEDRSDPDNPRVLVGEMISLRGEQAVYFKADSFTRIRVAE